MTDELYTQTEKSVRYWTREELLIRAETAENELATLRANTLLQLGINPDAVADDEALEAPPGVMAQKENEMIDEQEAKQRRLVEVIAELLNDEANTITDRSEKSALIAQIAALREFNRWRPVSETPTHDKPVLALLESGEYKVARYVVIVEINGVPLHLWCGTGGASKHVAYWRPIIEEAPG